VRFYRYGGWSLGPFASLDLDKETLTFPSGVLLVEGNRTIVANRGVFLFGEGGKGDRILLTGEVVVVDSARTVTADTLEVFPDEEEALARGVAWATEDRCRVAEGALESGSSTRLPPPKAPRDVLKQALATIVIEPSARDRDRLDDRRLRRVRTSAARTVMEAGPRVLLQRPRFRARRTR
jgi:hypothetical protein